MPITKAVVAKATCGVAVLTATGGGIYKLVADKKISNLKKEDFELMKEFEGKDNRFVLEKAGFKFAPVISKESIKRKFVQKANTEFFNKAELFCKEGLTKPFMGISEAFRALATTCTEHMTLKEKISASGFTPISEKSYGLKKEALKKWKAESKGREFFNNLKGDLETPNTLLNLCDELGNKFLFSKELDTTVVVDYMKFCLKNKPSVVAYWTGSKITFEEVKPDSEEK